MVIQLTDVFSWLDANVKADYGLSDGFFCSVGTGVGSGEGYICGDGYGYGFAMGHGRYGHSEGFGKGIGFGYLAGDGFGEGLVPCKEGCYCSKAL